ncbi:TonB-dependent receptor [Flavobacterium orientale]|uniref:TonB-dependent receptor n=1 Tax=Flavobacterium orientale TaxID=1756020 RepID=A0A916XWW8_9FLAO|nr:TonB-dependent receptor [Flavobacterium orientale]GGD18772.1 TonB-dependent receptor [Flavobacterium orientale]
MKTLFNYHQNGSKSLSRYCLAGLLFYSFSGFSQETVVDTIKAKEISLDEVLVGAVRVTAQTPVTFSNLTKKEFQSRNLGQDIPIMMNYLPSVVTTTDAGAGVGYTGIRVRGSDATRVNVTINGIPYNDSESQGTFWVNMPDFASSTESLQLQRGVGTSTNGAGAFGASLNILTDSYAQEASGEISNSFGSFNTRKHTLKFSTGMMNDKFEIAGRLSTIYSDGYIDRAFSDLKSYFLQGTYVGETTLIKGLVFGGNQKTYQAWYGLEDPELLQKNRTFNVAGMYFDEEGKMKFYDNETDNYQQDHYQLHWNERWNENWSTNLAFHYTMGKGYFEQYKEDEDFADYGLSPITLGGETIDVTDLIRRRWLDNNFYGTTFSANYKKEKVDLILGGGINNYEGAHFGEIIWARYASQSEIRDRYYDDFSTKRDINLFSKLNYQVTEKWRLFGDVQYRNVNFTANGADTGIVDDTFHFFNPKAGVTYTLNQKNNFYLSYAQANREPNRNDYENGNPRPEQLHDVELGWRHVTEKTQLNVNGYFMKYKDQLVLTGELNDVGAPIRANSGDSYRIGLEVDATLKLTEKWFLQPNVTLSQNKNQDFVFQRDGVLENLGTTNIAFSPNFIAANRLTFIPIKNLQLSFLSKFVGEQYMGNIDAESSKLDSYFVNDLNISYEITFNKVFKSMRFNALVNNIFDLKYESNGYFYTYDDDFSNPGTISTIEGAGFYPQAGINFLIGLTLLF